MVLAALVALLQITPISRIESANPTQRPLPLRRSPLYCVEFSLGGKTKPTCSKGGKREARLAGRVERRCKHLLIKPLGENGSLPPTKRVKAPVVASLSGQSRAAKDDPGESAPSWGL